MISMTMLMLFLIPVGAFADTVQASITPASSSKTTDAYSPNPINISVGDKVIWTNNDSTPHTATSGEPGEADGTFGGEAGSFGTILAPGNTQEFTFTEAGEFPYYCGLHPNMVGTVQVSSATTHDGEIEVSPDVVGPSTEVTVLITDVDLNQNSASTDEYSDEEAVVTISSDRNEVGQAAPDIRETGPDTGIFMFELQLITDSNACANDSLDDLQFEATGGSDPSIGACPGDFITIRYEDSEAANGSPAVVSYVIEVEGDGPETQSVTVNTDRSSYRTLDSIAITGSVGRIASSVTTNSVDIESLELQDITGNKIDYLGLEQVVMVAELTNNAVSHALSQPFVCIIQVRDSQGMTIYTAWQTGTISPNDQISVGLSWTPETIDRYQIRAFVINNLSDMQPISKIANYDTATGDFSIVDVGQGTQPLVLKISNPTDTIVLFEQIRVKPDRSYEYTAKLGGALASQSGSYEILATYGGASKTKSITFMASEQTRWGLEGGGQTYQVKTVSTSGVDRVAFFEDEGRLQVSLSGDPNIPGILYIIFPSIMMDHVYEVNLDGQNNLEFEDLSNPLYTVIKTQYSHSNHDINALGQVPIPARTNGVYSVKYLWSPCTPENVHYCNVHKDSHTAILELYVAHHDGTPATTVAYSGNIDNSRILIPAKERNMMQEGESIERVSLDGLSPLQSIPQPYDGAITITKVDGRSERVTAEIAISVIPEFPAVLPLIAIITATLVAFTRLGPKIWKL